MDKYIRSFMHHKHKERQRKRQVQLYMLWLLTGFVLGAVICLAVVNMCV